MARLEIKGLSAGVRGKRILRGVDLVLEEGDSLALLGPNGHGKSTLLGCIMGNPAFEIYEGSVTYGGKDVLSLPVDERSRLGIFLGMQNPVEVPGVPSSDFLKAAMNARREKKLSLFQFIRKAEAAYKEIGIPFEMAQRNLNEGFSGGERKKNEILQMRLLEPGLAMLDEIDSGLDVDAIEKVAETILKEKERGTSFLVISHYARLFHLIRPNRSAIMVNGRIVLEGGPELIDRIDKEGYEWLRKEHGVSLEKIVDAPMNEVSIGVCATKEALDGK